MKVRILEPKAGLARPEHGLKKDFSLAVGDLVEVSDELGKLWVGSGHAEKLKETAADKAAAEAAAKGKS